MVITVVLLVDGMIAIISFIIPLSSIPGRVALVVTQFLTLTNIFIHSTVSKLNENEQAIRHISIRIKLHPLTNLGLFPE